MPPLAKYSLETSIDRQTSFQGRSLGVIAPEEHYAALNGFTPPFTN